MNKKALVDVPVLLWVFVRPEKIKKVFEVIKQARPSTLFLISDGPRENVPTDKQNIAASRTVVEDIDWECSVHKLYFDVNQGVYPIHKITNEFVFKHVDRCIFLEDDVITSISFFKYCEVLLEKYKDDLRINMICGMNHAGVYGVPNTDYFFVRGAASIWGFAIWRRTYENFYDLGYAEDAYYINRLLENAKDYKAFCEKIVGYNTDVNYGGHPPSFEFFLGLSSFAHNQLSIIPKRNMVCNIGYGPDAAHMNTELRFMPKRLQQFFNMEIYELEFPLKHPKYVIEDKSYEKKVKQIMGRTPWQALYRRIETYLRFFYYGSKQDIAITLLKKTSKVFGLNNTTIQTRQIKTNDQ